MLVKQCFFLLRLRHSLGSYIFNIDYRLRAKKYMKRVKNVFDDDFFVVFSIFPFFWYMHWSKKVVWTIISCVKDSYYGRNLTFMTFFYYVTVLVTWKVTCRLNGRLDYSDVKITMKPSFFFKAPQNKSSPYPYVFLRPSYSYL